MKLLHELLREYTIDVLGVLWNNKCQTLLFKKQSNKF